jgi:hypothetical protein
MHCAPHHPELKHIPALEEEQLEESDSRVGSYVIEDMLGEGQFASVSSCHRSGASDIKYAERIIEIAFVFLTSVFLIFFCLLCVYKKIILN